MRSSNGARNFRHEIMCVPGRSIQPDAAAHSGLDGRLPPGDRAAKTEPESKNGVHCPAGLGRQEVDCGSDIEVDLRTCLPPPDHFIVRLVVEVVVAGAVACRAPVEVKGHSIDYLPQPVAPWGSCRMGEVPAWRE